MLHTVLAILILLSAYGFPPQPAACTQDQMLQIQAIIQGQTVKDYMAAFGNAQSHSAHEQAELADAFQRWWWSIGSKQLPQCYEASVINLQMGRVVDEMLIIALATEAGHASIQLSHQAIVYDVIASISANAEATQVPTSTAP